MNWRTAGLLVLMILAFHRAAVAEKEIVVSGFNGAAAEYVIKVESLQALIELIADPERKLLQALETENTYVVVYRVDVQLLVLAMYKAGTTGTPLNSMELDDALLPDERGYYKLVTYKVPNAGGSSSKPLTALAIPVKPGFKGYITPVCHLRPNDGQDLPKEDIPLKIYWE